MKYKIGDIVRHKFIPDKTGIVFGYALGCAFAPLYGFTSNEHVLLAMTEYGNVLCFKGTTTDYEIVGHSDFKQIFNSIFDAKTLDFKK
ncbi:MAG: hypothetical protein LIR46_07925 [Bacteroidota bacterium]|nr:hypothetical protein [Bacteroidota bacterium]